MTGSSGRDRDDATGAGPEPRAEIVRPAGPGGGDDAGGAGLPPEPTDEEVAALVAAVEVAWPRPAPPRPADTAPRWRFSGRWWSKPVPLRRSRPW